MAVRYILGISILVFQNLLAKTEYAKHVARKITFSEAAGQDNNTTGEQLLNRLFYWNVHLFAIVSIHGIWEVEDRGYTPSSPPSPTSISTCRNGMRWNLVPGIPLVQ